MSKPKYDPTVGRMAGNIAAGLVTDSDDDDIIVKRCVRLARAIIEEVKRTEPKEE